MEENRVDRETAEQEFLRFARCARLRLDGFRNEEAQAQLEENRQCFIEGVMDGSIEVDEEGYPTVITESDVVPRVQWKRRPRGTDRCAMDKCRAGDDHFKLYSWVGSVTGIQSSRLSTLEDVDWKQVWLVHQLFLPQ